MPCTVTGSSRRLEPILNPPPNAVIFGKSPIMWRIRQKLEIAAACNISVPLRGSCGSGKGVLARLIHSHSPFLSAAQKLQGRVRIPHLKCGSFPRDFCEK